MSEIKKETKKVSVLITVIIALVAIGVGFGLGTLFQKNQKPNLKNMDNQFQMGDRPSGNRTNGINSGSQNGAPSGQNNARGEVTKIDDSSITIKTPNGGSKLIMISDSTSYKKLTDGDKSNLQVGSQVIVDGESNSDGTITGKTISIN